MDHVLLYGPPGLGKTTLASIIAEELDVKFTTTSGPVLQKKLDLTGILTNVEARQVFFIDEVHRLMPDVEEMLYSALEDFRVDILVGTGPGARTHSIPMPRFTAIGATTRQGLVSAPLRGRFGLVLRLDPYRVEELQQIVNRSARILDVPIDDDAAEEIARRCRGTPRIANRLLRRVRDYAQVRADGHISRTVAQTALNLLEVDRFGLDELDQKIMLTVLEKYRGGPVGIALDRRPPRRSQSSVSINTKMCVRSRQSLAAATTSARLPPSRATPATRSAWEPSAMVRYSESITATRSPNSRAAV
jgi:Holliday junction DNA helicase RuvB